jgi:hypothetical protein
MVASRRPNDWLADQETDFVEGEDWCAELVRLHESRQLALAVYHRKEKRHTTTCRLNGTDRTFIPLVEDEVLRHVRFTTLCSTTVPSVEDLLQEIESLLDACLDLETENRFLLACFVMSTWLIDRLPIAPYVALVGPPGSGKTVTLKVLQLLCRRGLLTSDISSAAFYRACDRVKPTLLIDETATAGQQRALFHLLRSGTTRDVIALRENQSYRTFGAKAVAWPELPNDEALNSRCVIIPMSETLRTDLRRPDNPEIIHAADLVVARLFTYRLANYRNVCVPGIAGANRLRSRARDLYESLALAIGGNSTACARLLECMDRQEDLNRDPLPPNQTAVIAALHRHIHLHPEATTCLNLDLTKETNLILAESGERLRLSPRGVGTVLKTFGFYKTRTNRGWTVPLDRAARKLVHKLISSYGVDSPATCLNSPELEQACEFCKTLLSEHSKTPESQESVRHAPAPRAGDSIEELQNQVEEKTIELGRYTREEFEDVGDPGIKANIMRSIEIEDSEGADLG